MKVRIAPKDKADLDMAYASLREELCQNQSRPRQVFLADYTATDKKPQKPYKPHIRHSKKKQRRTALKTNMDKNRELLSQLESQAKSARRRTV